MKILTSIFVGFSISLFFVLSPRAQAQGSLTPSGLPAPNMKTLGQVEPRTAISGPVTISQPGSYYLAANVSISSGDIITITTNNIKLDLNGFALTSTDVNGGSRAIYLSGSLTNITIVNGLIYSSV